MLVGSLVPLHRAHVNAALVRESGRSHEGLAHRTHGVQPLPHDTAQLGQTRQMALRQAGEPELQLQVGDDRRQIDVATALSQAVDRSLHLDAAGLHRCERIRDGEPAVVVDVDAEQGIRE